MDRNFPCFGIGPPVVVALRKESVDRNLPVLQSLTYGRWSLSARRAWIEILVHRAARAMLGGMSLSARRAWIEILDTLVTTHAILSLSARRAWIEIAGQPAHGLPSMSLSARRAWIEILRIMQNQNGCVSLSARRAWIEIGPAYQSQAQAAGRSPQGERG